MDEIGKRFNLRRLEDAHAFVVSAPMDETIARLIVFQADRIALLEEHQDRMSDSMVVYENRIAELEKELAHKTMILDHLYEVGVIK